MVELKVKLKLSHYEAHALGLYFVRLIKQTDVIDARLNVVVLTEFFMKLTFKNAVLRNSSKPLNKECVYTLPLSVVMILHYRLQKEEINEYLQQVLVKLDKALVDRGMNTHKEHQPLF